ncbi:hypothetical protein, partial [Okeania sp. SIO3B5]|uniref:hypothetical protein n=1 Tax=Okeania sp. SIO3B5 TaxID=2607811 RepID=UPI0025CD9A81
NNDGGVRSQESGVNPPLTPPRRGRLKLEEGRRRTGVEGESFFITLLSGHDIIALQELVRTFFNPKTLLQLAIPCSLFPIQIAF